MTVEEAAQVIRATLALPPDVFGAVPWDSFRAEAARAADHLMARTTPDQLDVPSVELLMERVLDAAVAAQAERGVPAAHLWYYPRPHSFAVFLSHDVDEVAWSWRRRLLMAVRHPSTIRDRREPYWNFEKVAQLEEALGWRSGFYVVPFGTHPRDPPYTLAALGTTLRALRQRGWEIGVHGSYESFDRPDLLASQKGKLEEILGGPAPGVRQHFIHFDAPRTWEYQERAGFLYDSTLAARDRAGFRTGFCHPYAPGGRILEIPLVVMDGQLFWYEKLDPDRAYARTRALLETVAKVHGVATLNWHQHTMDELSFPGWWDVLRRCLTDLARTDAWFARGVDLATWWNRRSAIRLEEHRAGDGTVTWDLTDGSGGPATLRVFGPGAERGRIQVAGTDRYEVVRRSDGTFVAFADLPAGVPVRTSWAVG